MPDKKNKELKRVYHLFLSKNVLTKEGIPPICDSLDFNNMNELYNYVYDTYIASKQYQKCKIHDISVTQTEDELIYHIPAYLFNDSNEK